MSLHALAKKDVLEIKPYVPGKPVSELSRELCVKDIVKLASNENPLGVSPKAAAAMQEAIKDAAHYPDGGAFYLKQKLAKKFKVDPKNIIVGNGSSEIIEMAAQAFLNPGEDVITCWPTFTIYSIIAKIARARLIRVPLRDYRFDLDGIACANTPKTKMVIVCNPNNPTGTYVDKRTLDEFIARLGPNVVVVIDEAYCEFADEKDFPRSLDYLKEHKNVLVMRTFSKIAGMAGLRLGYAFGHEEMIDVLNRVRPPFNVNSIAQAGAVAALDDEDYIERSKETVREGKKYLYEAFAGLKLPFVKSAANFILVKVGKAHDLFEALLKRGVIIRALDTFDMPEYIRVTVGTPEQNARLIDALKEVLPLFMKPH
ncbi:MAG TPA: histidinol-phosphate transaminase [bacterium]|nr:histidinol-phosphate transaminase [bacterium]